METIYLAKWETRFWAWLIDSLLIGALHSGIAGFLMFIPKVDLISLEGFGVRGVLMFVY